MKLTANNFHNFLDCNSRENDTRLACACLDCSSFWCCFHKATNEEINAGLDDGDLPSYIVEHLDAIASPKAITERTRFEEKIKSEEDDDYTIAMRESIGENWW